MWNNPRGRFLQWSRSRPHVSGGLFRKARRRHCGEPKMSAKADIAVEVIGASLALTSAAYGAMFTDGRQSLLWFMAAGAIAGAVVSAVAGKAIGIDIGLKTLTGKLAVHLCVVVFTGPIALDWAIKQFPNNEPEAIASLVGGSLALFGASMLILVAPWLKYLMQILMDFLSKKIPKPQNSQEEIKP